MATCKGADVSAIQATSAWTSDGLAFLIAKASEGQTTRDAKFATHIAAANAKRIVTGGYHFGWPVQAVAKEAANYAAAAKATPVDTHWLDLEAYSDRRNVVGMSAAQIKSWGTAWVAAVKNAFPSQNVGVYASLATFQAGWVPTNADGYWVAQYPVAGLTWAQAAARARPKLPAGYPTPLIWQFASTSPALDRDLAYLSSTDLAAWARKETPVAELTAAQVYAAVWKTDSMTPPAGRNAKTNPTWAPESVLKMIGDDSTAHTASLAALSKQVTALQQQVTALQTAVAAFADPAGFVAQVAAGLAQLQVTVTTKEN